MTSRFPQSRESGPESAGLPAQREEPDPACAALLSRRRPCPQARRGLVDDRVRADSKALLAVGDLTPRPGTAAQVGGVGGADQGAPPPRRPAVAEGPEQRHRLDW